MEKREIEQLTEDALDAFWEFVAERFPNAKTGDLSPLASFALGQAAETAVKEWIGNNATPQEDGE